MTGKILGVVRQDGMSQGLRGPLPNQGFRVVEDLRQNALVELSDALNYGESSLPVQEAEGGSQVGKFMNRLQRWQEKNYSRGTERD